MLNEKFRGIKVSYCPVLSKSSFEGFTGVIRRALRKVLNGYYLDQQLSRDAAFKLEEIEVKKGRNKK